MQLPPIDAGKNHDEKPDSFPGKSHDPTPEEIAAACAEIRASWTEDEKIARVSGIQHDDDEA